MRIERAASTAQANATDQESENIVGKTSTRGDNTYVSHQDDDDDDQDGPGNGDQANATAQGNLQEISQASARGNNRDGRNSQDSRNTSSRGAAPPRAPLRPGRTPAHRGVPGLAPERGGARRRV